MNILCAGFMLVYVTNAQGFFRDVHSSVYVFSRTTLSVRNKNNTNVQGHVDGGLKRRGIVANIRN